jgi:hypothetical protein
MHARIQSIGIKEKEELTELEQQRFMCQKAIRHF